MVEDDRNWSDEIRGTLSYIATRAPNFPKESWLSNDRQPTLESVFSDLKELLDGLRKRNGDQAWMKEFLVEIEKSYVTFVMKGRCREAVAIIDRAAEIMEEGRRKRKGKRSEVSKRLKQEDEIERSGGTT